MLLEHAHHHVKVGDGCSLHTPALDITGRDGRYHSGEGEPLQMPRGPHDRGPGMVCPLKHPD